MKRADLFFIAGEMSGDQHGAALIRSLLDRSPSLTIHGVGGEAMTNAGMHPLMDMEPFTLMGISDIPPRIPRLLIAYRRLWRHLLTSPPRLLITIDSPALTLRLARSLKKRASPSRIIHYICPSGISWCGKEAGKLEQSIDHLLTIFPSDIPMTIPVDYVGNPTLQGLQHRHNREKTLLSLFPGSRKPEVVRNLPLQVAAMAPLAREKGKTLAISSAYPSLDKSIKEIAPPGSLIIPPSERPEMMERSALALATSGTITLEIALRGIPMVVSYAMRSIDAWVVKKIMRVKLPYYSLPNLIMGRKIIREHYGPKLSAERVRESLREAKEEISAELRGRLAGGRCAADILLNYLSSP
ncbi:MAG: hypothetical protein VXZ72_04895 [Chlamydiota bacterium]|nr:hypothetical protein [Chlamydiota bacterium]